MIQTKNLQKTFVQGEVTTPVLKGIDFKAEEGEFIAIMGRSGAGKSTFLYQMSLLDDPTGGEVIIDGENTRHMSFKEKMQFRLMKFGYVFQDYALLPELTALENVALRPMGVPYLSGIGIERPPNPSYLGSTARVGLFL